MAKYKFQFNHDGDYIIETTTYSNNDSLALMMYPDGCPDDFTVLSVNLGNDMLQDKEHCFIDSNNCPFAEELLLDLGIAEITFINQRSGFCTYPLLRINLDKFTN